MMSSSAARPLIPLGDPGGERWLEFEAAIGRYRAELHRFAYRVLGERNQAEDALQNALVKAFQAVRAGDVTASLKRPWLYRVVYRCCLDELRRAARTSHDALDEVATLGISNISNAEIARAISEALLNLPPHSRAAVLLVDVHGLSYDEAAAALEVPRGTIASRLNHGRRSLRQALVDYGPESGGFDD